MKKLPANMIWIVFMVSLVPLLKFSYEYYKNIHAYDSDNILKEKLRKYYAKKKMDIEIEDAIKNSHKIDKNHEQILFESAEVEQFNSLFFKNKIFYITTFRTHNPINDYMIISNQTVQELRYFKEGGLNKEVLSQNIVFPDAISDKKIKEMTEFILRINGDDASRIIYDIDRYISTNQFNSEPDSIRILKEKFVPYSYSYYDKNIIIRFTSVYYYYDFGDLLMSFTSYYIKISRGYFDYAHQRITSMRERFKK